MIRQSERPHPTSTGIVLIALSMYTPGLAAQVASSSAARVEAASLPAGLPASIAAIAVCGALGAFAADLVTDGGRLDRVTREASGWVLGFVAKLVVGAVAALILLTVNPPGGSWLTLIGTAITAGVGGEALLLSIVSRKRADEAEREAEAARESKQRTNALTHATLRTVRDRLTGDGAEGERVGTKGAPFKSASPAPDATLALMAIDDALSAMAVEARSSVTETVRGILERVLRRKDVDKQQLKDIGGDQPRRQMIAMDIGQTWDGQFSQPFTDSDVSDDDTLATLGRKVRDLLV